MTRSRFRPLAAALLLAFAALAQAASPDSSATQRKVLVYYFYFTPRCETCLNIEAFAKQAVDSAFASELQTGAVEWHAIDTGKPADAHYWTDFKLESKSLVMVEQQGGQTVRWKNCEKVWDLVGAKPEFLKYVEAEVRSYLTATP